MEKKNIVKPNFSKNKVNKENLNNERKVVEKEATVEINQEVKSNSILEQAKLLNEQDKIIKDKEKKKMEKIAYLLAGLAGAVVITAIAVFGLLKVSNIQEVAKPSTQVEVTDNNAKERGIELTDEIKQEYTQKIKNVLNEEAKKFYSADEAYGATYTQFLDLYQWYRLEGFSESSSYQLVINYLKTHSDSNGAIELNDTTKKELQELADNNEKIANYGEAVPEEVDQSNENIESAGDMNGDTSEGVEITDEMKEYNESPESTVTEEDNTAEEPKQEDVYVPSAEPDVDNTPSTPEAPATTPEAPADNTPASSGSDDSFWGSDGDFTDSWNNIDSTEHGDDGWKANGEWSW